MKVYLKEKPEERIGAIVVFEPSTLVSEMFDSFVSWQTPDPFSCDCRQSLWTDFRCWRAYFVWIDWWTCNTLRPCRYPGEAFELPSDCLMCSCVLQIWDMSDDDSIWRTPGGTAGDQVKLLGWQLVCDLHSFSVSHVTSHVPWNLQHSHQITRASVDLGQDERNRGSDRSSQF